jgi:hypothetical protein
MKSERNRRLALLLLIGFTCSTWLGAQNRTSGDKESCRRFTQTFYDWYVAKVFESFDHKNVDVLLEALDYQGQPFSRELVQGIRKVRAEEKKSHEAILDFDPILNTQDAAAHYQVRKVTERDGHFLAEIYGVWDTPHPELGKGPQVVAEMTLRQSRWVFINFHYPNSAYPASENLLRMLESALR